MCLTEENAVKNQKISSASCSVFICVSLSKVNTSVLHLDLTENGLEADGVMAICEMLKDNCYINELHLGENNIGEEGSMAIEVMLRTNSYLMHLDCKGIHRDLVYKGRT